MKKGVEALPQPLSSLAAGDITARDRGCEPVSLADEAGGQPTGTGGSTDFELRDCQRLSSAFRVDQPGRTRPFRSHERAIARLREEFRIDQSAQECIADVPFKTPQALCLHGSQPKSGHFYELTLNPLKNIVDTHGPSVGTPIALEICQRDALGSKRCTGYAGEVLSAGTENQALIFQLFTGTDWARREWMLREGADQSVYAGIPLIVSIHYAGRTRPPTPSLQAEND